MNLYGYAAGDPVNNSDPFGLSADSTKQGCPDCARPSQEPSSSILPAGKIPAGSRFNVKGLEIEIVGTGFDLFASVDTDGNLILSGSGTARLHGVPGIPDPRVTHAAVNFGTGDYGAKGYVGPFGWPRFETSGNYNHPKQPTAPAKDAYSCAKIGKGC